MELQEHFQTGPQRDDIPAMETQQEVSEVTAHSLLPCDGGIAAWRLLISAFVFEALLWGFPLSFGVFQNYYSQLPQFAGHPYISIVGTTASGISYIGAPIMIPIIKRFARHRRIMIWAGWPLCIIGLVAGSFAQSLGALIMTQGIMYGLGFVIFYYPIISMVNDFWVARRGMAYGILCSASGLSGTVMPFAFEAMLNKYGYPTTLRAVAVGLVILTGPLIPLLKTRTPDSDVSVVARTDWAFLRVRLFWIYTASNFVNGFGYFIPSLYLPSYATSIGLSSTQGALLLAIMSIAQVLGQTTFGYLSDRKLPINILLILSTAMSSIAVFVCWGFAHTFGLLILFSMVYGYFGAGYVAMWARMGTAVSSEPTAAFAAFGLFNLGKGVGNVLTGPISGYLIGDVSNEHRYAAMKFEGTVLFAGTCMLVSGSTILLCYMKHLSNMFSSLSVRAAVTRGD
ncbi:MFS transporter, MCP family, solute carrier family 16, member 10, variant [Aulographum hederae CBS 113979]|uniref:MFS transporter, MCP family, solute carrier family 16, member 10, variant n=1 Tax=Aulographum hederae CBS 113979 TaxID=1176131 RepID=A0A6G1H2T3_9PEZI|nr:MFS transporter, MCP family, solute carrier family 16, member 10, variant [Aulographum hederae CBS 113979]